MLNLINKQLFNWSFAVFVILALGLISIFLGKDLSWDIANYHIYAPYVFLHHRWDQDFWPASFLQIHLTPTLDLLNHFLRQHFSPWWVTFILGSLHGVNVFLVFLIALPFIQFNKKIHNQLFAAFLAILGIYSAEAWSNIGSFSQDNTVSIFVLLSILLQLYILNFYTKFQKIYWQIQLLSGFILGIGLGLKLTASIFVLGMGVSLLFVPDNWRLLFLFGIGVTGGFFVSDGYWLIFQWQHFHNPFFPLFNHFFHLEAFDWSDPRFFPRDIWQKIFYPFIFATNGYLVADGDLQDSRFAIVYLLFIFAGMTWLYRKYKKSSNHLPLSIRWLFLFFIFSYLAWEYLFSNLRYLTSLEMLTPFIIYLLIVYIVETISLRMALIGVIFYFILFSTHPVGIVRAPWFTGEYINVQLPQNIEQNSPDLVLMAYSAFALNVEPRPQSYLIPYLPAQWSFIGMPFLNNKFSADEKTIKEIRMRINSFSYHHIFLLTSDSMMPELYRITWRWGLIPSGFCSYIISDRQQISHQDALLCPVMRIGKEGGIFRPNTPSSVPSGHLLPHKKREGEGISL